MLDTYFVNCYVTGQLDGRPRASLARVGRLRERHGRVRKRHHLLSRAAAAAATLLLVGAAAACSSGGSSSAGDSAGDAAASASSSASSPGLATAQAFVAKYQAEPASIGSTTPLPGPVPKGKTIVFPENDNPQTRYVEQGMAAAAKALGLNLKVIPYALAQAPASLLSAMQTALQLKPYAVVVTGTDEALWQNLIPAFAAAHVYIIPQYCGVITKPSPWILPQVGTPADSALAGQIVASKFISESNGQGQAVLVNVPDISVLGGGGEAIESTVKQTCPACKLTTVNIPVSQFATDGGVSNAISALQRNPGAKYVLTEQGASDQGLPAALSAAGLSGVQIIGFNPSTTALQYAKDGQALGFATTSFGIIGWMVVDVAAQKLAGVSTPDPGGIPVQLLVKSNLADMNPIPPDVPIPTGYEQMYLKKWNMS